MLADFGGAALIRFGSPSQRGIMRYLTIQNFGTSLGVDGARLVVRDRDGRTFEESLSRLRAIRVEKKGISISSNLILACAARGIRIFFLDWRGLGVSAVISPRNQHAVVRVREAQFRCFHSPRAAELSAEVIRTKIKNERTVLLYFGKSLRAGGRQADGCNVLMKAASQLKDNMEKISALRWSEEDFSKELWSGKLMGIEGASACVYWNALIAAGLMPKSFLGREGHGATESTNAALNYGYAVLESYVWVALDNAGFELFEGMLHAERPGRPSLVLDFMEEYRAWVVDRNIIKLRKVIGSSLEKLEQKIKRRIVDEIDTTMQSEIKMGNSLVKLENIMQRQAYRLSGAVVGGKRYRGIGFSW